MMIKLVCIRFLKH